jgi:hypothetical protein
MTLDPNVIQKCTTENVKWTEFHETWWSYRYMFVTILKMATGRNFSMSGINSGHQYLPTYKILMISDNVEFLSPIFYVVFWQPFWKSSRCPISMTFHMWVDYDVPNWFLTSKNFSRSPFSKWPPQCCTNSTLFDFNVLNWFSTSKMKSDNVEFVRYCGGHFENGER